MLGFDVIDNWNTELKEMNKAKIGGVISLSKHFPSFTWICQSVLLSTIQAGRQTEEGIAQGHAKGKVPSIPDYTTTISRRINRLDIKIENDDKTRILKMGI